MDGYDFIAQYLFVIGFVLCAAHRKLGPMCLNMNIERVIREQREKALAAARARVVLMMMKSGRVA